MRNILLGAFATAMFMFGIYETMTISMAEAEKTGDSVNSWLVGVKASYFWFMLATGAFFWMKYIANKVRMKEEEKEKNCDTKQDIQTKKKYRRNKKRKAK